MLLTTVFSFPLVVTGKGFLYRQAWEQVNLLRYQREQGFRCGVLKAVVSQRSPGRTVSCSTGDPAESELLKYFTGKKPLKPRGWHRQLLQEYEKTE